MKENKPSTTLFDENEIISDGISCFRFEIKFENKLNSKVCIIGITKPISNAKEKDLYKDGDYAHKYGM